MKFKSLSDIVVKAVGVEGMHDKLLYCKKNNNNLYTYMKRIKRRKKKKKQEKTFAIRRYYTYPVPHLGHQSRTILYSASFYSYSRHTDRWYAMIGDAQSEIFFWYAKTMPSHDKVAFSTPSSRRQRTGGLGRPDRRSWAELAASDKAKVNSLSWPPSSGYFVAKPH